VLSVLHDPDLYAFVSLPASPDGHGIQYHIIINYGRSLPSSQSISHNVHSCGGDADR
jgi:hypothetical protein